MAYDIERYGYHFSSSDVALATNELAAARVELTRLHDRERELLVELRSVRSAARVQQDKINDLFKQQRLPAPITRLPLTVLSDIIHRVILDTHPEPDAHRCTKRELASVSRLWRDAIFTFPNLWTTVAIDPLWSISLVMSHVERSGECPLDIIIRNWTDYSSSSLLKDVLGVVVTCGYRWRSLVIQTISGTPAVQVVKSIWRMRFISLESVKIFGVQTFGDLPLLTSRYTPSLKHLMIRSEGRIDQLPATSSLQTGIFQWFGPGSGSLLSCLPSYQQLRKLILCGRSDGWPRPQSIHLPALVSLTLKVADPQLALAAMVVPNLNYLEFPPPCYPDGWVHMFEGFPNMFTNIRHLRLIDDSNVPRFTPFLESAEAGAMAVCAACPGVRHLELHADDIPTFFHPNTPTERWSHLECLTLEGLRVGMIPSGLIQWINGRTSKEERLLQVTLSEFHVFGNIPDGSWLTTLRKSIRGRCLFKLKDVPLKSTLEVNTWSQGDTLDSHGSCDSLGIFSKDCFEG